MRIPAAMKRSTPIDSDRNARRDRRGVVSVIAMMFLVIFG